MLLFLAIAAGLFALYLLIQSIRPLVETGVVTAAEWQRVEDESLILLERRDQLLAELQELEFEAALDKIDARDLAALRKQYEVEAIALDKQLEDRREQYGGRIEAQVEQTLADAAARRATRTGEAAPAEPAAASPAASASDDAAGSKSTTGSKGAAETPAAAPSAPAEPDPAPAKVAVAASAEPAAAADLALLLGPDEEFTKPADCGVCGNTMDPGSAFCDGCGAKVMRACGSCGAPNRPGARFCKSCGSAVRGEAK